MSNVMVIGLAGGTGSGKTTITKKLMQRFLELTEYGNEKEKKTCAKKTTKKAAEDKEEKAPAKKTAAKKTTTKKAAKTEE